MRFVDLFNAISSGAPAVLAAERHHLQFDGVGDYAVADAVFGGISGDYTIAIKVAGRNEAGSAGFEGYFSSGGPGATNQDRRDYCYGKTTTFFVGVSTAGATTYSVSPAGVPSDTAKRVLAVKRDKANNDAYLRVISTSGAEYSSTDTDALFELPDHIVVAARCQADLTPVALRYGATKFVGLVLASVQIPDAELTAWLNDDTAIGNITGIDHYWCASDIIGATIPARVGTVALALTGPTSSDLVAWSPS